MGINGIAKFWSNGGCFILSKVINSQLDCNDAFRVNKEDNLLAKSYRKWRFEGFIRRTNYVEIKILKM